ncbi:MAG: hypothetical protein JXR96_06515, partial [Deltaproteobacteria bacterium]|nr:hypothetical protein [Deltaproteobacteria bacterium]
MKVMRMFCLMLAAGMLALGLAGCPGEQYLECGTESCDPGTCIPGDGADATCDCPPGYKQGEGLTCVMGGLPLGAICTEDSQCVDGRCLKYTGQAEGYCTKTDCGSDSECVNHADDGLEMCCVEVDVAFFICMKIGEGCQCGDGTGTCGASCTCMSDSACQPGFPCLATSIMDPGAICSKQCTTDDDCNDCVGGAEDEFACIAISGGDKYCLKSNVQPCERNLDCDEGEVCMVDVVDGLLVGSCGRQGALDPGAECNDEDDPSTLTYDERCAAVFCFNDMCSSVCTLDSDCPEGMTCETIGFIDMPEQTIDMCFGPPITGEAEAGDPCPFNGTNADADYCLPGLACLGYDRAGVATPCTTDEDCFDVLPPAENPDCADDGMCGASFCSPPCDENNECEDGFYPALVGDDCYCIPETTGTSPAGGPCPFNGTNDDADFCQSGLTCLGYDRAAVNYPCDDDEDCLEALPPAENPDCADDGMCGASFCSPPCDENNECEPGFYPALVGEPPNQQCYCIPETTGSSGPGDPCPFNG